MQIQDKNRHIFKVLPSHSVSYWMDDSPRSFNKSGLDRSKNRIRSQMSKKSKATLSNCFNWIDMISGYKEVISKKENRSFKFRLSFITLTLSDIQIHSDAYVKRRMLEPFLRWIKDAWDVKSYIWKAETQNNGNIHFHITTNKFIHWKSIRSGWNRILSNHGYCKMFQDGSNDKGDSATEIRAVRNEKEIKKYIAAYVGKKDLFKKVKVDGGKKVKYIYSEICEITKHYYVKENHNTIYCTDGNTREYKRTVKGRLWGASSNLNESAVIVSDLSGCYPALSNVLTNDKLVKIIDHKVTESGEIINFDFHKVYLYKKKIFKYLPITVRNEFKFKLANLKANETSQQILEIDTFY